MMEPTGGQSMLSSSLLLNEISQTFRFNLVNFDEVLLKQCLSNDGGTLWRNGGGMDSVVKYCQDHHHSDEVSRVKRRSAISPTQMPVVFMPTESKNSCKESGQSMSAFGFLSFVVAVVNVVISNINSNNNNNNQNSNNNNNNNM